jgi:hypothetical protein
VFDQQTISDRLEIHDLMIRYGMAVDRRDWDLYRTVFTDNARIDYTDSGGISADIDEMAVWIAPIMEPFAGLQHNMTNHMVVIDGDTASSCTYFVAVHSTLDGHGGEVLFTLGGFYQDRLVRTPLGWRIAERAELGVWLDGPGVEGIVGPRWHGQQQHHAPSVPF